MNEYEKLDLALDYLNDAKVYNQWDLDKDEDGNSNGVNLGSNIKATVPQLFTYDQIKKDNEKEINKNK